MDITGSSGNSQLLALFDLLTNPEALRGEYARLTAATDEANARIALVGPAEQILDIRRQLAETQSALEADYARGKDEAEKRIADATAEAESIVAQANSVAASITAEAERARAAADETARIAADKMDSANLHEADIIARRVDLESLIKETEAAKQAAEESKAASDALRAKLEAGAQYVQDLLK